MAKPPRKAAEAIAKELDEADRLAHQARVKCAEAETPISTDGHANAIQLAAISLEYTIRAAEHAGLRVQYLEGDESTGRNMRFDIGQQVDPIYD